MKTVYTVVKIKIKSDKVDELTPYACGYFDSISGIKLKVLEYKMPIN